MTHRDAVRERLDALLADRDLEAAWLARPNSFAWATGGGDNLIERNGDIGVAALGYDGAGFTVVTDNIEAERLAADELPDDVAVEAGDWYGTDLADGVAAASPTPAAADFDVPGLDRMDPSPLRQPMTDGDVGRYRRLGADAAAAVEAVARSIDSDDTERTVAARLHERLVEHDADAPVVLVGGAERAQRYRHYTPTEAELGDYALLSVVARRGGLHASCTRTVAFDPPEWLADRTEAAMTVEASALAATRAVSREGGTASDVFEAIREAYEAVGHPGEWRRHHQGGAAGYAGREWIATPTADDPVERPMAYAWNPTVQGAKSEDTALVTDDGIEVLTTTDDWPTETVQAIGADATLERHAPLRR